MSPSRRVGSPFDLVDPDGEGRERLAARDRELMRQANYRVRTSIPIEIWREWEEELRGRARRERRQEKREAKKQRCGARCRTKGGAPCDAPLAKKPDGTLGKRCRMHSGVGSGPKTPEGKARALSNLRCGVNPPSQEAKALSKLKRGPNRPQKGES